MPRVRVALRLDDLWADLKARLLVPSVTTPLGPATDAARATRVYLPDDVNAAPVETQVWGRVNIVPVERPFETILDDTPMRDIGFLTLVEFTAFAGPGWSAVKTMAIVQAAIAAQLEGYTPDLSRALLVHPITLNRPPQAYPLRDASTRLWYTSAEYLCRVAAAT